MRHNWEDISPSHSKPIQWLRQLRQCTICGRVQEKYPTGFWMRTTGHRWEPLVGRCPGSWQPNDKAVEMLLDKK